MCVGGRGGGCIPKQQNLSRAMRDWDLIHEEGATLSTMCNHLVKPARPDFFVATSPHG